MGVGLHIVHAPSHSTHGITTGPAINAAAGQGRMVLLEARLDGSDRDACPDGGGGLFGGTTRLALEFTQSF